MVLGILDYIAAIDIGGGWKSEDANPEMPRGGGGDNLGRALCCACYAISTTFFLDINRLFKVAFTLGRPALTFLR